MVEESLHYFCCFECSSLSAIGCVKGCSKQFRVWSPRPSIAISPLADFTPSPNTRVFLRFFRTPASATKFTFEATWKMSNFRISVLEKKCQPPQAVKSTALAWLPVQSRAVKKKFYFCTNFRRWKTFRKVPVKYFWEAWEGLNIFRSRFSDPFSRSFQTVFRVELQFFQGQFRSVGVPPKATAVISALPLRKTLAT